jgi:EmrB/QacA subfamily drug resistance transporter
MTTTQPATGHAASGGPVASHVQRHLGPALVVIATAQLMVVLDATIVNVALPDIQKALGFSGTGLEWVVNAYALTFGGLLLLGGRAGDVLGRRRVFIAGIILFSLASLLGGFATTQAWLLAARAVQGAGGAIIAPTALSLITTTFPEGPPRNRAMGVYAAMSIGGAAVGLIAGGLLTTYLSWRWVLFANVPIGAVVALLAPRALAESQHRRGRFDLPGAITSTLGLAALVYGLTSAATSPNGVSHWGDTKVIVSLTAAVVLLATFVIIEARSEHALMPLRIFRNRDRSAANLIMLCIGTAMFGMFFFLTIFVQTVWGYSALKTGVSYLPMIAAIMVMAGVSAHLVTRIGARPLLLAGAAVSSGGMFWLSRINEHSTYAGGLLGPTLVTAAGLGTLFMPITLVALSRVPDRDAGLAASLPNVGQQVGGSIGLALLGTVAWTVVADTARRPAAAKAGHPPAGTAAQIKAAIYDHALSAGFSRGFEVSAGIMLIALIVTVAAIRVKRADLAGTPATMQPAALDDGAAREAVGVRHEPPGNGTVTTMSSLDRASRGGTQRTVRAAYVTLGWVVLFFAFHVYWYLGGSFLSPGKLPGWPHSLVGWIFTVLVAVAFPLGALVCLAIARGWPRGRLALATATIVWLGCALLLLRGGAGVLDDLTRATGLLTNGLTGLSVKETTGTASPSTYAQLSGWAIDAYFLVGGIIFGTVGMRYRALGQRSQRHPS